MFDMMRLFETQDLWDYLKGSSKKKVLYGMGDGADKVLDVCQKYGIEICGVFASDDFVRYQQFRSFTVKKYSDLKEEFSDFIILVAFASSLPEIIQRVKLLAQLHELYIPDVPVYGQNLFNHAFAVANKAKILKVYDLLCDSMSKKVYFNALMYKLTGKPEHLFCCESSVGEAYGSFVCQSPCNTYVDVGAYNGDTIREFLSFVPSCKKIYALEPDERSYKKLLLYAQNQNTSVDIEALNIAAWDRQELLSFSARGGRNSTSSISGTRNKIKEICAMPIDSIVTQNADYIKIDSEGSEKQVIDGMKNTVLSCLPTLNIAIYHRSEDMFDIPLQINSITNNYLLYMRHFPYFPCWDTNLYAVKRKAGKSFE